MAVSNAKEASEKAKLFVADFFKDEGFSEFTVEEFERDLPSGWAITIGFTRPTPVGPIFRNLLDDKRRDYRLVRVNNAGEVTAVKTKAMIAE